MYLLTVLLIAFALNATRLIEAATSVAAPARYRYPYKGCYTDTKGQTLSSRHASSSRMTREKCSVYCAKFLIFGVENGKTVSDDLEVYRSLYTDINLVLLRKLTRWQEQKGVRFPVYGQMQRQ